MPVNQDNKVNYPIDLNADLGEGSLNDEALLQIITSANIACGGHAGDNHSMLTTVKLAKQNQVTVGAHPSFPDRRNFGRQAMDISTAKLQASLQQQITALKQICDDLNVPLQYVKPHGALYNLAATNADLGQILIDTIKTIDPNLNLMILAGSSLVFQARQQNICVIEEAFADRAYLADASLAPRNLPGAVIGNEQQALDQVSKLVAKQAIETIDGKTIIINADSLCLHGDNEHALAFAQLIAKQFQ
ncbi:5-oxoprolinase subunit PxpA [Shewanella sp. Isolate11]|uniref:5-oxoprolinase subunit PxpA n=1 Tax=Shewanella sp. Isolate11 TaxID=2908530 RepID=UPI001EFE1091|nr:5-oxoprolinase subunit PxpA [Shewanella sp. Isolate11]MCG9698124.1 5-oxoprolinase subunit PxpA [Shewanella sp. Isolate11]